MEALVDIEFQASQGYTGRPLFKKKKCNYPLFQSPWHWGKGIILHMGSKEEGTRGTEVRKLAGLAQSVLFSWNPQDKGSSLLSVCPNRRKAGSNVQRSP